ncbi:hypothetical protein ACL02P_23915 [Paenibacillus sp. MB22_1]|uniref:hypothetical protein n=1 Tax=Paenibacillus sp. MB22_1 TaxID=3383121 RepID=UPI0039A25D10
MNLLKKIESIFHLNNLNVSERMRIVEGRFDVEFPNLPSYEELKSLLEGIVDRDTLKVTMISDSDDSIRLVSRASFEQSQYDEFKAMLVDGDNISVSITIEKTIEGNMFSVYHFDSFTKDLLGLSTLEAMASFSYLLEDTDHLTFELFDKDYFFCTSTMAFIAASDRELNRTSYSRTSRLSTCRETSYFFNANEYRLLPEDFDIEINFNNNPLTELFQRICTLLSLVYISSTATIDGSNLKIQIAGQRSVDFSYRIDDLAGNKELYKIYQWIYTEGSAIDKAIIARNIISLHCRYADLLDTDGKTFASIQSNFNLYLKSNVTQYLDLKNKLAQFICDVVAKTGEHANQLLKNFKSNLFAICIFLFTVVLTNIVSDQPLQNIFTKDITLILELVIFGSMVYLIICLMETKYNLRKTKESYTALKINYDSVLSQDELKEIFDDDRLLKDTVRSINRGIWLYSILWVVFLLLLLVILEYNSVSPIIKPYLRKGIELIDRLIS